MSAVRSSSTLFPAQRSSAPSLALSQSQSQLSFATSLRSYPVRSCHVFQFYPIEIETETYSRGGHTRAHGSVLPQGPPPPGHWKSWVVGTVMAVLLTFVKSKWGPLLKLREEIEMAVEAADKVAEVVEMVAETMEKAADVVADNTPEDSKIHSAAALIEMVAKEVAKDAHLADAALDKVEEVEKEVEKDVESLFAPIINQNQASRITKELNA